MPKRSGRRSDELEVQPASEGTGDDVDGIYYHWREQNRVRGL